MSDLTPIFPEEDYLEDWDAWAQQDWNRSSQARQTSHPQGETSKPTTRGTKRSASIPMEARVTENEQDELIQDVVSIVENTLHGMDNYGKVIDRKDAEWSVSHVIEGYMNVMSSKVSFGPGEADTFGIAAFAVPHDGQLTVCINHIDGIKVIDNAEEMFPSQ